LIGTGVTQAIYTNAAAATTGPTGGGTPPPTVPVPPSGGTKPPVHTVHHQATHIAFARLVKRNGHWYLVIKVTAATKSVHIRVVELTRHGKTIRTLKMAVRTGSQRMLVLPASQKLAKVKVGLLGS
jgi:hypothetical protein